MIRFCLVALAACAIQPTDSTAPAPLTGNGQDAADRSCNVVLRGLTRNDMTGLGNYETNGDSWVFEGAIEVSADANLVPQIMWTRDGKTWSVATATATTGATPGYARYLARLDHDTVGPAAAGPMQVVPFLTPAGGGRLFDHNRHPGDVDNYVIAAPDFVDLEGARDVRGADSGERATLTFAADFTQRQDGVLIVRAASCRSRTTDSGSRSATRSRAATRCGTSPRTSASTAASRSTPACATPRPSSRCRPTARGTSRCGSRRRTRAAATRATRRSARTTSSTSPCRRSGSASRRTF